MNGPRRTLRIACVDVARNQARMVLNFIAERYDIEFTRDRDADYVIHSCAGLDVLKYPGVRIFITGENVSPNFAISDYAMAFDRLEFSDRYLWLPLSRWSERRHRMLLAPRTDPAVVTARKTGFCAYVMSNTSGSDDARVRIFDLLNAYKQVSSGGRWRNNVGGAVEDKRVFQSAYKFAIAFENCSYPGYLTEKLIDAAIVDAIPIYWGDPDVGDHFNSKAFINCHEFSSLEQVVERVREIDGNDELYMRMLREPWFKDGVEPDAFRRERIAGFLAHIFDQPLELAYRRNRGRWGIKYERNLYDMHFRPHVQFGKRLRAAWRRCWK